MHWVESHISHCSRVLRRCHPELSSCSGEFGLRLVFPPTFLSCSSRYLLALQQNRAQSRLLYLLNKRQCFLQCAIFFALEWPFSPSKINFRDTFFQNFMWVSPILKVHFEYLYDFIKRGAWENWSWEAYHSSSYESYLYARRMTRIKFRVLVGLRLFVMISREFFICQLFIWNVPDVLLVCCKSLNASMAPARSSSAPSCSKAD